MSIKAVIINLYSNKGEDDMYITQTWNIVTRTKGRSTSQITSQK